MAVSGYAGKLGWTVGRVSWLDDPASLVNRYWRQIEQGQSFEGVILIGLWGDSPGAIGAQGPHSNLLRNGEPLTRAGGGGGDQKFVPFGESSSEAGALKRAKFALWYYITDGKMGNPTVEQLAKLGHATPRENKRVFFWLMSPKNESVSKIPFVSARAKRSVEGRQYYAKARASFDPMQVEVDMLRKEIGSFMRGVFTGGEAAKNRKIIGMDSESGAKKGPRKLLTTDVGSYLGNRGYDPSLGYDSHVGLVTVTAGLPVQDLIKAGGGHFPAGQWQAMLIAVNARVAAAFQDAVVAEMVSGPHRRPATDDLVKATRDPRNRYPQ